MSILHVETMVDDFNDRKITFINETNSLSGVVFKMIDLGSPIESDRYDYADINGYIYDTLLIVCFSEEFNITHAEDDFYVKNVRTITLLKE